MVFVGFQRRAKVEQKLEQAPPLLVLTLMVLTMFVPFTFAVPATISIVILSVILIACLKNGTLSHSAFTNKNVIHIGLISYSLYLWHWGVLSLNRLSIGVTPATVLFQILLIYVVADLSYRFIETPFRRNQLLKSHSLMVGILVALLGAIGSFMIAFANKKYSFYAGYYAHDKFVAVQDGMSCELAGNNPTKHWRKCLARKIGTQAYSCLEIVMQAA